MTLNRWYALYFRKDTFLKPTTKIWMKIDPYCQWHKCRPMTLVSENIMCMWIYAGEGSFDRVRQTSVGLSTTAIFIAFVGYFFENFRHKGRPVIWRYAIPCRPLLQNERPLSLLHFMSRCIFVPAFLGSKGSTFKNCVKSNESILAAAKM